MPYPVDITDAAEADLDRLYDARRADPAGWYDRLLDAVVGIGEMPESYAIAMEQPDDPAVPILRELIFGRRADKVRVFFRFDGTTVRVLHARHARDRPLSDSQFRRIARP